MITRAQAEGALLIGLCVYEPVAITTGRVPTVSALCREHRWIEGLIVVAFALHLHWTVQMEQQARRTGARIREGGRGGRSRAV